ncbi:hypothetical protein [Salininema proteolyticum]|uniref:Uncharacterized protein n=1 Tax=Salininema proteolyticum TaxID=1607685 RepID=A0ABV8U1M0_9ACTN
MTLYYLIGYPLAVLLLAATWATYAFHPGPKWARTMVAAQYVFGWGSVWCFGIALTFDPPVIVMFVNCYLMWWMIGTLSAIGSRTRAKVWRERWGFAKGRVARKLEADIHRKPSAADSEEAWTDRVLGRAVQTIALPVAMMTGLVIPTLYIAADRQLLLATAAASGFSLLGYFGTRFFNVGRDLVLDSRRSTAPTLPEGTELPTGEFVLYLRTFRTDRTLDNIPVTEPRPEMGPDRHFIPTLTQEESLVEALSPAGPVVAIGNPKENLPRLGAVRMYCSGSDWQATVADMIGKARLTVISIGAGEGTMWEIAEAMRLLPPQRLLLLVPDRLGDEEYRRISVRVAEHAQNWPPAAAGPVKVADRFPPDLPWRRLREVGFLHFGADWTPHFATFQKFIPTDFLADAPKTYRAGLKAPFTQLEEWESASR